MKKSILKLVVIEGDFSKVVREQKGWKFERAKSGKKGGCGIPSQSSFRQ